MNFKVKRKMETCKGRSVFSLGRGLKYWKYYLKILQEVNKFHSFFSLSFLFISIKVQCMMDHNSGSPTSFRRDTVSFKALFAGGEYVLCLLLLSPYLSKAGFGDSSPSLAVLGHSVKGGTFPVPPQPQKPVPSERYHGERTGTTASSKADISFPLFLRGIFRAIVGDSGLTSC